MSKRPRHWQTTAQPSGPSLTDIGAPLRSLAPLPGSPTAPLPGSRKHTHRSNTAAEASSHDPRVQCAPGEAPFGAGFAAVGLGRDITTGRRWA
jgi:hypothetical protein